ncbi:hypothetical protein BDC45DRAFT_582265 [Circinella umbellata]|nr:hypothetical protein BDC45DRAFT_582265 [Circinella umbellata]
MLTSTLCNIERVAPVAVTSFFPDPRRGCEKVSDNFFGKTTAYKCGDLFILFTVWCFVIAGSSIVIMDSMLRNDWKLVRDSVSLERTLYSCTRRGYLRSVNWSAQKFLSPAPSSSLEDRLPRYQLLIQPDYHDNNKHFNDTSTTIMNKKHTYPVNH